MRAAALLIASLFVATVAARAAVHAVSGAAPSSAMNVAEQAIANAEAAADMSLDPGSNDMIDLGNPEMDMPGNTTAPAPPPRPAWMGGQI
ncbi:hypothetical protein [Sphingosinicella sp.]|uniref:hypothetical protein n=1 Tax=Sphingosinicella sp. TaxID=1917971 RepID=UPI0040381013